MTKWVAGGLAVVAAIILGGAVWLLRTGSTEDRDQSGDFGVRLAACEDAAGDVEYLAGGQMPVPPSSTDLDLRMVELAIEGQLAVARFHTAAPPKQETSEFIVELRRTDIETPWLYLTYTPQTGEGQTFGLDESRDEVPSQPLGAERRGREFVVSWEDSRIDSEWDTWFVSASRSSDEEMWVGQTPGVVGEVLHIDDCEGPFPDQTLDEADVEEALGPEEPEAPSEPTSSPTVAPTTDAPNESPTSEPVGAGSDWYPAGIYDGEAPHPLEAQILDLRNQVESQLGAAEVRSLCGSTDRPLESYEEQEAPYQYVCVVELSNGEVSAVEVNWSSDLFEVWEHVQAAEITDCVVWNAPLLDRMIQEGHESVDLYEDSRTDEQAVGNAHNSYIYTREDFGEARARRLAHSDLVSFCAR